MEDDSEEDVPDSDEYGDSSSEYSDTATEIKRKKIRNFLTGLTVAAMRS